MKKKKPKADRKAARAVTREFREAFCAIRVNVIGALEDNIDETQRTLLENLEEKHPKAAAAAKRGFRELRSELRREIQILCNDIRDYHAEHAIERQFGLMTIGGKVSSR